MTNSEIAKTLAGLAEFYAANPDEDPLSEPNLFVRVYSKEMAVRIVKGIGGTFKKRLSGSDTLIYESQRLPGLAVWIPRDKVCRVIPARYDCEPLLAPAEEVEVFGPDAEGEA